MHAGEPYFRLIKFSDFAQLMQPRNANGQEVEEESKGSHDDDPYSLGILQDPMRFYIVTPRGMVGSKRTHWNRDLQVGR